MIYCDTGLNHIRDNELVGIRHIQHAFSAKYVCVSPPVLRMDVDESLAWHFLSPSQVNSLDLFCTERY